MGRGRYWRGLFASSLAFWGCGGPDVQRLPPQAIPTHTAKNPDSPPGDGSFTSVSLARTGSFSAVRLDQHAECDGLLPRGDEAQAGVSFLAEEEYACIGGAGDGSGYAALGQQQGERAIFISASLSDGQLYSRFDAPADGLASQPGGWQFLQLEGGILFAQMVARDGSDAGKVAIAPSAGFVLSGSHAFASSPAPSEGGLAVTLESAIDSSSRAVVARRLTAAGGAVYKQSFSVGHLPRWVASAVGSDGTALLLWDNGTGGASGYWLSPAGAALQAASVDGLDVSQAPELTLLADASAVGWTPGEGFRFHLELGSATPSGVPAWLAAASRSKIVGIREGRAYALVPRAEQASPCGQSVEIFSRSGRRCGTLSFSLGSGRCTTGAIGVGRDGTLLQQLPTTCDSAGGVERCTCSHRWWPGLLN